jgi:hypothetical protein
MYLRTWHCRLLNGVIVISGKLRADAGGIRRLRAGTNIVGVCQDRHMLCMQVF